MPFSLHTLPVELVYRILDQLDKKSLFISCRNVCTRLDNIVDTYHPYQTLITLYLTGNKIGDGGAEHLAHALQQNTTLTTLDIGGNQIGDGGAEHPANALQQNPTLTTLDLSCDLIKHYTLERIQQMLKNNT